MYAHALQDANIRSVESQAVSVLNTRLCDAVAELAAGLIDADLAGRVYKKSPILAFMRVSYWVAQ